jgi:hypothetical protein
VTRTEMVFETLVFSPLNHLTRLTARENFIILSRRESNKSHLILFVIRMNFWGNERNVLLKVFIKGVIKMTAVITEGYQCYILGRLAPYSHEITGHYRCISECDGSSNEQTLCIRQLLQMKWVNQLLPMARSTEKCCTIFITEFGILTKLVRLIKMWLHETYRKVSTGKHSSDAFPIQNGLK